MDRDSDERSDTASAESDHVWDDFRRALAGALEQLGESQFLVLEIRRSDIGADGTLLLPGPPLFVQFVREPEGGMRGEAVSNTYLSSRDQLTPDQQAALIRAGWLPPTYVPDPVVGDTVEVGSSNYYRDWEPPAAGVDISAVAASTLREIFGAQSPDNLTYRASGHDGEALRFDRLGIPSEPLGGASVAESVASPRSSGTQDRRVDNAPSTPSVVTETIESYRRGTTSWPDLVKFITDYPWKDPVLPDSGDYLGWSELPDTFQDGTWGEVTGAHLDELLTDDEYFALTEIFDALP